MDDRTTFGRAPTNAVGLLALLALAAAILFFVTGALLAAIVLFLGAVLLGALFAEQSSMVGRSRELAGFAGASARAWGGASREVTRLRIGAQRLTAERNRLQHELGAAAYEEDQAAMTSLRMRMHEVDEQIRECGLQAEAAVEAARRRTKRERLAVAPTQVRKP
ncbi:MAG TPA: hypothetical protein VGQ38_08720 [Gaiellaceae bacterium]|jgi:hypothetical protein|nr:hypothetical protein [Gaiellaceae bacterium]